MDNKQEPIVKLMNDCGIGNDINFCWFQPRMSILNTFVKQFNGNVRRGVPDAYLFPTLEDVRQQAAVWMDDNNHHRPHEEC